MLFVCFSAFNEAENIEPLLKRISGALSHTENYRIIAYDDGSKDPTLEVLQRNVARYPLIVLHEPVNGGLGCGINALVSYVCDHGSHQDIAVLMDGDDTHDPMVIGVMCEAISRGADVVIASRYHSESVMGGISLFRSLLSVGASLFWRVVLAIPHVRDYTCGFRAYRVGTLQRARNEKKAELITRTGFECQVELLNALRSYAVFDEVGVVLAYDRKQGVSKMRILKTSFSTLSLGLCLMVERLTFRKQ